MARRGRPSADPDDDKTDIHIIMQLRKVINLRGNKIVEFRNGDSTEVVPHIAQNILNHYDRLTPVEKFKYQEIISESLVRFEEAIY